MDLMCLQKGKCLALDTHRGVSALSRAQCGWHAEAIAVLTLCQCPWDFQHHQTLKITYKNGNNRVHQHRNDSDYKMAQLVGAPASRSDDLSSEIDVWRQYGERRESIPARYPLTSTQTPWLAHTCTPAHKQTHTYTNTQRERQTGGGKKIIKFKICSSLLGIRKTK